MEITLPHLQTRHILLCWATSALHSIQVEVYIVKLGPRAPHQLSTKIKFCDFSLSCFPVIRYFCEFQKILNMSDRLTRRHREEEWEMNVEEQSGQSLPAFLVIFKRCEDFEANKVNDIPGKNCHLGLCRRSFVAYFDYARL